MTAFWTANTFFVHVPKNGGTSINRAFREVNVDREHKWHTPRTAHGYEPASWYRNTLGKPKWDGMWSFAIVRNPWDRIVSQYRFSVFKAPWKLNRVWPVMSEAEHSEELYKCRMDFKYWLTDFCENRHYWPSGLTWQDTPFTRMPQTYWLYGGDKRLVKKVYRFEEMDEMWADLGERFGVVRRHEKASRADTDYRDHYDDETRAFVEKAFADDIERFAYSF